MSTPSFKLLQYSSLLPALAAYRFKKDIPKEIRDKSVTVMVDCGLWGRWWVPRFGASLLLKSGEWLPVHFAHLMTGMVVGVRDLEAGRGTKHAEGWRESYKAVIDSRLNLANALA